MWLYYHYVLLCQFQLIINFPGKKMYTLNCQQDGPLFSKTPTKAVIFFLIEYRVSKLKMTNC